jgi:hypothetical protein
VVDALPQQLDFVAWTGRFEPAYRVSDALLGLQGRIRYVTVVVYPRAALAAVERELPGLNAGQRKKSKPVNSDQRADFASMQIEIDRDQLPALARLPNVRWLGYAAPEPRLAGEREVQIVAGNFDGADKPKKGYLPWLHDIGLSGAGVCIAICDSGVDVNAGLAGGGHCDFGIGRFATFVSYSGAPASDKSGHGTSVASIALGNAATDRHENNDPNDFLWGLGVAPRASFVVQNALASTSFWPPLADEINQLAYDAITNGAHVMNNSWEINGSRGYTDEASRIDWLVRDADDVAPGRQSLVFVSAAGNGGSSGGTSIWGPHEAKNVITVGAVETDRDFKNSHRLLDTSSRGPAHDGRLLPTVVAPGLDVSAARSSSSTDPVIDGTGTYDANKWINAYTRVQIPGTSYAAPHVSGVCALLIQWWLKSHTRLPTPAMLKALLVNGAVDLSGSVPGSPGPIPNNDQGWGRVNIRNIVLDAPLTDRGPRICIDNAAPFTGSSQRRTFRIAPAAVDRCMRITLVWTDPPASIESDPARVNDLNLEVQQLPDGPTYKGNHFANGFSVPGGQHKQLDNVECVYLDQPRGTYEVRVRSGALRRDSRPPFGDTTLWQDFALVMDNAVRV